MDRYNIALGGQGTMETPPTPPNIIRPMEVQIAFQPEGARWYIQVKKGKEWETVTEERSLSQGYSAMEPVMFSTRQEVEEYCRKKGLI